MPEANEFDLEQIDNEVEKESKVEKRIKDLSEKVRLTAEERDEQARLMGEQKKLNEDLTKERDFLNSFGDSLTKHPEAAGFKDKIKEKVMKGYSVEDATAAVLVAEGKFTPPESPIDNPAGGSAAVNQSVNAGEKSISEMNREEKRAALLEAEKRGEIFMS